MTSAICMTTTGGPDVLEPTILDLPAPGPGEVRLRHGAIGVNFVDVYHRTGLYALPGLPAVLGVEGAGTVTAIGDGVVDFAPGDRVAWAGLPAGGYAEARNIAAERLIRLPETIDDRTAAAIMLRGITAHMLLERVVRVGPGTTLLVHAAAGGLGLILTRWAKALGARVIGTVGSEEKAETALAAGLDHAILHRRVDFVAEVRRLTDGRGVDVAYDGIGGDTLRRTFDAVRPFGTVASIGQVSGPIAPVAVTEIGPVRSLSLARPSVFAHARDLPSYRAAAAALFARIADGLTVAVGLELPLSEAAEAHRRLEAGTTSGSIVLVP